MACKCAEDYIFNCHKCGGGEQKELVITPKKSSKNSFWALCGKCFEEEGGVWWTKKNFTYTVNRSES